MIFVSTIFMILVTFLMLIKTFFFLRIFNNLSYIVTMMKRVFYDLRVFILCYSILILMFSAVLGILRYENFELSSDPVVRAIRSSPTSPGKEYKHIGVFIANFSTVTRISLGDFDFSSSVLLDPF